jgi:hypothetical protein
MKTSSRTKNGAKPDSKAITSASSRREWPKIIMGPTWAPRRELSLTVTVNSGPGIRAPDKAKINEVQKMVKSANSMEHRHK